MWLRRDTEWWKRAQEKEASVEQSEEDIPYPTILSESEDTLLRSPTIPAVIETQHARHMLRKLLTTHLKEEELRGLSYALAFLQSINRVSMMDYKYHNMSLFPPAAKLDNVDAELVGKNPLNFAAQEGWTVFLASYKYPGKWSMYITLDLAFIRIIVRIFNAYMLNPLDYISMVIKDRKLLDVRTLANVEEGSVDFITEEAKRDMNEVDEFEEMARDDKAGGEGNPYLNYVDNDNANNI